MLSIEKIDELILTPVYDYLVSTGEDFRIMILPDHPTPIELRTHSSEPVPFMIWCSDKKYDGVDTFTEDTCEEKKFYIPHGYDLLSYMIDKKENRNE